MLGLGLLPYFRVGGGGGGGSVWGGGGGGGVWPHDFVYYTITSFRREQIEVFKIMHGY